MVNVSWTTTPTTNELMCLLVQIGHEQFPDLSIVPADDRSLEAVHGSLVPPEIDANAALTVVPPIMANRVPDKEKVYVGIIMSALYLLLPWN